MGPTPREENRPNEQNYEEDGWYIGYEVQMEGLGVVNVYGETNSDSESDGYVGPENDSDDENAETRRAGYMSIPSNVGEENDSEDDCNVRVNDNTKAQADCAPGPSKPFNSNVSPPVQKAFEKALNNASTVHLSDKDFHFQSVSNDIQLSQDKINEIKSSMAGFQIPKPEWADETADEKILKYLNKNNEKDV